MVKRIRSRLSKVLCAMERAQRQSSAADAFAASYLGEDEYHRLRLAAESANAPDARDDQRASP